MLVKAIKQFRDKYTRKKVRVGDAFEAPEQRVTEINAAKGGPYVAPVEAMAEEPFVEELPVEEPFVEELPVQKRGKKQEKNQPDPPQEPPIAEH